MEVLKWCNNSAGQNRYGKLEIHKNMGYKFAISSDLGFVSNILSFPSIICVD